MKYSLGISNFLQQISSLSHSIVFLYFFTLITEEGFHGILLLLLSRFSRVRLCETPQTAAHQPSLSLGFSRQEHWSGLPFPSPMNESEKWKSSRSVVSNSSWPRGLQPTRLLHPWDFPGKSTGVGCYLAPKRKNYLYVQNLDEPQENYVE